MQLSGSSNWLTSRKFHLPGPGKQGWPERILFFLLLLISLVPVVLYWYLPSLDGPQHLCTSNVIVQIVKSNELVNSFFSINSEIVGNWTGHFILALFDYFLPGWLAEKCLIIIYYIGMALGFRYLLVSFMPGISLLSLLIIPFSSTSLLMLGYYNYSIAIVFLLFALGYWKRIETKPNLAKMSVFSILLLLTFLSHTFVYTILGFILFIFILVRFIDEMAASDKKKAVFRDYSRKLLYILIAAIPSIYLWFRYLVLTRELTPYGSTASVCFQQLLDRLLRIEILTGFDHMRETPPNRALLICIVILILYALVRKLVSTRSRQIADENSAGKDRRAFLAVSLSLLALYFVFPNEMISGNISNRIGILFFIALIIWLNMIRFPRWLVIIAAAAIFVITVWHRWLTHGFFEVLNDEIAELTEINDHLEPNSVILPWRYNTNWVSRHFCCYAGLDMPVVNLGNPQCMGQFPVVWDQEHFPNLFFGGKSTHYSKLSKEIENPRQRPIVFVDYVIICGKGAFEQDTDNPRFKQMLNKYFEHVYTTSKGRAMLFRFKAGEKIVEIMGMMLNKEEWLENIRIKAENRNIPLENMMILDAIYMYDKYY